MSVSNIEPVAEESARETHALAFRIAFATAISFTLGNVLGWDFPFLPAVFALQILTGSRSLNLRQAAGFAILMTAGCIVSVLIAQIFIQTPLVLLLVVALLIFFAFLLLARGQATAVASILLITASVVPLVAISSLEIAVGLVESLIAGSILAALLVLLAYAFFPSSGDTSEVVTRPAEAASPVAAALANSGTLVSLVILFMLSGSPVTPIVIMTAITILQQPVSAGYGTAYAFVMGNVAGGVAATAAYLLVSLFPVPAVLLLLMLLFGLIFGGRIAQGAALAPVYIVALTTFLIVLGLGLTPVADSGELFIERVFNVLVAAAYTIGVASVLRALFRAA
jgi:hypothetical protein